MPPLVELSLQAGVKNTPLWSLVLEKRVQGEETVSELQGAWVKLTCTVHLNAPTPVLLHWRYRPIERAGHETSGRTSTLRVLLAAGNWSSENSSQQGSPLGLDVGPDEGVGPDEAVDLDEGVGPYEAVDLDEGVGLDVGPDLDEDVGPGEGVGAGEDVGPNEGTGPDDKVGSRVLFKQTFALPDGRFLLEDVFQVSAQRTSAGNYTCQLLNATSRLPITAAASLLVRIYCI